MCTDWISTLFHPSRSSSLSRSAILQGRILLYQMCRPLMFCCAEMVFLQPAESLLSESTGRSSEKTSLCRVKPTLRRFLLPPPIVC